MSENNRSAQAGMRGRFLFTKQAQHSPGRLARGHNITKNMNCSTYHLYTNTRFFSRRAFGDTRRMYLKLTLEYSHLLPDNGITYPSNSQKQVTSSVVLFRLLQCKKGITTKSPMCHISNKLMHEQSKMLAALQSDSFCPYFK